MSEIFPIRDDCFTEEDKKNIANIECCYNGIADAVSNEGKLISIYNEIGKMMQDVCNKESNIKVYSFQTHSETHSEASRLVAKLRNIRTQQQEFVYYTQRAYELLFNLAYGMCRSNKNYLIIKTPVDMPFQQYAVHKINNVDDKVENTIMCVMLRGALLPSMIMSKEIQEYSSHGYVTPFALFKISRDETKEEHNMQYILELEKSFFDIDLLNNKDLVFADPMNATGGSLVTVVNYLTSHGVKPKSIQFFNILASLKGVLRVVRSIENCKVWTLWVDPALNSKAYITPGLGDAGDRINGKDSGDYARNIIQLISDYGTNITQLYRTQVREIEKTILGVIKPKSKIIPTL
ncbi:MAG: uracil phosphoribosyltransferase [Spirochaetaceae bacterium]|jgi:uracil phosphoribosyltransferase|nr:uracil phosphoribosyltransferase [Spirochaetaceae bacterium]